MDKFQKHLKDVARVSQIKTITKEVSDCEVHGEVDHIVAPSFAGSNRISKRCCLCAEQQEKNQEEYRVKAKKVRSQQLINNRLDNAILSPRFKDKTFDNYKVDGKGQKEAVQATQWLLNNFEDSMGLIFLGAPGTGKNHLAAAVIKEVITLYNKTALMTEAVKIIRAIKESWRKDKETETEVIKRFITPDLLVIDELGVQFGSETEKMYLTEIVNDRYNAMKVTILIGNLSMSELQSVVGERAVERFKEGGRVVVFDWESHRGKA